MKSLSEIETTSKRASRAIGYSWGEAEEIGRGIRLLELFGLAGIKSLNDYYNSKNDNKYEKLNLIKKENISNSYPYCPLTLGINFLDQIRELEKLKEIRFNEISFPLLFLPFLSRSTEVIGKKIQIQFGQVKFLLNLNVNISSNIFNNDCPKIAHNVGINIIDNKDNFYEKEWKNLYKLSEKTFVEETESLKQSAAGAGLTDND
tara:strand:- start:1877 stop:2488 length:612 start_codon:yes stop_codon:yes gene_type:complete